MRRTPLRLRTERGSDAAPAGGGEGVLMFFGTPAENGQLRSGQKSRLLPAGLTEPIGWLAEIASGDFSHIDQR
ncbi:MAG: hypothetical protein WAN26_05185 [Steroidobacteraceae bacterium]